MERRRIPGTLEHCSSHTERPSNAKTTVTDSTGEGIEVVVEINIARIEEGLVLDQEAGSKGPDFGTGSRGPDLGTGSRGPDLGTGSRGPDLGTGSRGPDLGTGSRGPDLGAGSRHPITGNGLGLEAALGPGTDIASD